MIGDTRSSVCLALLMALLAALSSPSLSAQDKLIDLTVVGSGSDFKIQFLNSACMDNAQQGGCIEVQKGESGTLTWELDSMGETYWMLTRFQFSADGVNWGDSNFPLPACNVKNFNLEARDQFTGNAASAMITGNGRKVMISNSNEEECQTHYRIYAMPKAGGMEIHSDSVPMISSQGGGSR
ncbi:MAG: hypothetical protein SH820_16555 [Xanthomonadales bacterium]|nr:hypothetical protein [Xanthomonadales bacterium]